MKTNSGLTSPRQKFITGNHHSKEDHLGVLKPFEIKTKREQHDFRIRKQEYANQNLSEHRHLRKQGERVILIPLSLSNFLLELNYSLKSWGFWNPMSPWAA